MAISEFNHAKLAELRADKSLTIEEAAKGMGVNPTTLATWESGMVTPKLKHLLNLLEFYGIERVEDMLNPDWREIDRAKKSA